MYTDLLLNRQHTHRKQSYLRYNGCELHNNCFNCPFKDCKAPNKSIYKWELVVEDKITSYFDWIKIYNQAI